MANCGEFLERSAKIEQDVSLSKIERGEALIVGAGPSGMAVAACLWKLGVRSTVLERESCVASLWQQRTYDRLKLHIDKKFCELPFMSFPSQFPTFVSRSQFVEYLEEYAKRFSIQPLFCQTVESANFCEETGKWRVVAYCSMERRTKIYSGRFLVVATGENSEKFVPDLPGIERFEGIVVHSSEYKSGEEFNGKKVLVVGCGNSGMEIALDLLDKDASPSIVVRSPLHVLPREIFGLSTFFVFTFLLKIFPLRIVDRLLLLYSRLTLGDTTACGIARPKQGPLELKRKIGKTPVLDVGTMAKIRSGDIKTFPKIKRVMALQVEFEDHRVESFNAIIFATGYRSGILRWLKIEGDFFGDDGFPRKAFPNNWKEKNGLYTVVCAYDLIAWFYDMKCESENSILRLLGPPNIRE
ncbi:hypothetical protein SUGI_0494780 [Cryptomeria japonica]|nr:hypothetical protein SUGI_0494780 [Cryptomeria japonica]